MSVENFSSLVDLEVTEKFELVYFFGWVGDQVAGESGIKANLWVEVELGWVEAELGKKHWDTSINKT